MLSKPFYKGLSFAKINLFLHVVGRSANGYHDIQSFVAFINLHDKIEVAFTESQTSQKPNIKVTCGSYCRLGGSSLQALQENNILSKTLTLWRERFSLNANLNITLEKNIPIGGGLGGGSANAATLLHILNEHSGTKLSTSTLADFSRAIGADVPMCVHSTSAFVEGIGDKIAPLPLKFKLPVLLVNPNVELNTGSVFKELSPNTYVEEVLSIKQIRDVLNSRETFLSFLQKQSNSLRAPACIKLPALRSILNSIQEAGAIYTNLSGSGATCFGVFTSKEEAEKAANTLKNRYPPYFIHTTHTLLRD